MIKLIAMLTMLLDHTGIILFPQCYLLRAIGRLSMPLYAYCIARGYYYSEKHGTIKKYIINLSLLSLVSEIPYFLMVGKGFNIGLTWLFAVTLLYVFHHCNERNKNLYAIITFLVIWAIELRIETDYGIYGVLMPIIMYYCFFEVKYKINWLFTLMLLLWAEFVFIQRGNMIQILSVLSLGIIMFLRAGQRDNKLKLPKKLAYWFYPAHISVLLAIRWLITIN